MESENALSPIEPTAAPLPPTEAMDESTKTLPAPLDLSKKSPAAPLEPSQKWLQPYCDSPKGLTALLNQLRQSPTCDLLAVFFASFKAVYVKVVETPEGKQTTSFVHDDEIEFFKCYKQWQEKITDEQCTPGEVAFAKEVVEAKLQRIFKELYYIGQVDMPSATFCGCVDVAAMMEGQPFHGYNERDLSVREARDLKQKIIQKYEGVGQESIFLMLKEPINLLSGKMVPDFPPNSTPLWSVSEKRKLLAHFASLKFESYLAVEPVMIPCCGKKQFSSFLLHMCVQSKLSRRGTGQHRSYAFQELMAEDEDSFN